mgnify:CR=1 FL=1
MSASGFAQFIPLILIFVIFYFLLIRPQQKRVAEHKLMISKLTRGDTVVTAGGIVGKISRVIDEEKALHWLSQGAQPTETAARLLSKLGITEKFKTIKEKS